jgi:hypothetical protein
MSRIHRLIIVVGTVLVALVMSPGPANAYALADTVSHQDLRSPDARDAALPADTTVQDLRSPDSRDAADGRGTPIVVQVERTVQPAQGQGQGLSWDSIGLGALITAGLLASVAGAYLLIGRRRGHGPRVA